MEEKIHFSENIFDISDIEESEREILNFLKEKESIKVYEENKVFFINFCGYFYVKDTKYLIIPQKLAEIFKLTDINKTEIYEKYDKIFSNFLYYILTRLIKI